MDDSAKLVEIYKGLQTSQGKYTYFLLAAAGAGIALAVNQTQGDKIEFAHVPLALAVVGWAFSFYAGCKYIEGTHKTMHTNAEMLRAGQGAYVDLWPGISVEEAAKLFRELADEQSSKAGKWLGRQYYSLLIGALLFVAWHIGEMVLAAL